MSGGKGRRVLRLSTLSAERDHALLHHAVADPDAVRLRMSDAPGAMSAGCQRLPSLSADDGCAVGCLSAALPSRRNDALLHHALADANAVRQLELSRSLCRLPRRMVRRRNDRLGLRNALPDGRTRRYLDLLPRAGGRVLCYAVPDAHSM